MKKTIIITDPCYIENHDGINFLINRDTIYGDWSCMCYKGTKNEVEKLIKEWNKKYFKCWNRSHDKNTEKEFEKENDDWVSKYCYGQFCADSGQVCVAYLDEVLKSNPDFLNWIKEHSWCVTVIPDFQGTVSEEIDEGGDLHLCGNSDTTPFYTTQSGL